MLSWIFTTIKRLSNEKKKKKKKKNSTSNPQDTENVLNAKMRLFTIKISVFLISEVSHKKMNWEIFIDIF